MAGKVITRELVNNKIIIPARTHKFIKPRYSEHTKPSEHCMNPWNPSCRNTDIELDIRINGKKHPICRKCWEKISRSRYQW